MRSAVAAAAAMLVALAATASEPERPTPPLSGFAFQSPETQAMQADDAANPGLLWVAQGQALWRARSGTERTCADCHGEAATAMKGVAARYPAYDPPTSSVFNLERRINQCRSERQSLPPLAYESDELLALTAYVAHQSRGQPVAVAIDGPARPFFEAGHTLYEERSGQLNLACRHCHDQNAGRMLRGDRVSQGQSNGYPAYRLEWQSVGSLQRWLRFCHIGLRAEPFAYGAPEYLALELYLAWRAQGLAIETPAVRR